MVAHNLEILSGIMGMTLHLVAVFQALFSFQLARVTLRNLQFGNILICTQNNRIRRNRKFSHNLQFALLAMKSFVKMIPCFRLRRTGRSNMDVGT